ncbi:uncharacterized protein LOC127790133 [Diospyros lotus]|uniref:uncharacterized protein LOC127790133 n=1 Tax=Diospyros lotus TaxID=55363 RepID=UPI002253E9BE|nr:uncharacterized protein LOC127790133 [Diospyros lotus]
MDFYSYRLFERPTEYSTILRGGKLFQEFLVDAWAATEQNRLTYYKLNQVKLRAELYQELSDMDPDYMRPSQIGQRFILPSSFTGKSLIDFPPMPQPTANWSAVIGKTFLYNMIALKCRNLGHIVITVASSGIASLLLVGGRTAHSTFSIPLDVLENSNCGLNKQSLQAELFRETKLIIWDEVPMQHRHYVEAVDRTLRDICDSDKPFGGITVVLGGDFRQILLVIPKRICEQIVNASLKHSVLWKHIHILTLDLNMCLNHEDRENANFANFLMEIGTNPQEIVNLPSTIHKCQDLNELLSTVYPRLNIIETSTPTFLTERTILSARNNDVSDINTTALNIFPGRLHTYLAADKMSEDNEVDPTITNRYPNEYLNSLDPSELPTFKFELKVGCPIILLRNIAPKDELCNGTRLMVTSV